MASGVLVRPTAVDCSPVSGYGTFDAGVQFEIRTDLCNYLTVQQPSARALVAGTMLHMEFSNPVVTAPEPAEAHVAVQIGTQLVWDLHVRIPNDAQSYSQDVALAADAPLGTLVFVHLHNHGLNSWHFWNFTANP